MAKKKAKVEREGYGRLLEAWDPPDTAGEPINCLSTTFTFEASFFEVECLARFTKMNSGLDDGEAVYLIEREEKLAKIGAAIIVDVQHCKGSHNLRWDVLLSRVKGGCQHAKVSLLHWDGHIRAIITSANMTSTGYRYNQEVFGVLDWHDDGIIGRDSLELILRFAETLLTTTATGPLEHEPGSRRAIEMLQGIRAAGARLRLPSVTSNAGLSIVPLFTVPKTTDIITQLIQLWPESTPPVDAEVVSPFFDSTPGTNAPASRLWEVLRQRDDSVVRYSIQAIDEADGHYRLSAPKSLLTTKPIRRSAVNEFHGIPERVVGSENMESVRSLHAKSLKLIGTRYLSYMIGSSNFTSKGLGLSPNPNYEANLVYIVDSNRAPGPYQSILQLQLASVDIGNPESCHWEPELDDTSEDDATKLCLPASFQTAIFRQDGSSPERSQVLFRITESAPKGWKIYFEDTHKIYTQESDWIGEGRPANFVREWLEPRPPGGFELAWEASEGVRTWLPLNVENSSALPPLEELRHLPLELLISILTSAVPMHRMMQQYWEQQTKKPAIISIESHLDPHKRVDTAKFLLQRIRRISTAFLALRSALEKPFYTKDSLHWRLRGPVGVMTVVKAVQKESNSPDEKIFLLSELCLELSKVHLEEGTTGVHPADVRLAINEVITDIQVEIRAGQHSIESNLQDYINAVFKKVAG